MPVLPPTTPDNFVGDYEALDYNINDTTYINTPSNYTNDAPTYIPLELAF